MFLSWRPGKWRYQLPVEDSQGAKVGLGGEVMVRGLWDIKAKLSVGDVTQNYLLCTPRWEREPSQKVNEYSATFKDGKISAARNSVLSNFFFFFASDISCFSELRPTTSSLWSYAGPWTTLWKAWVRRVWAGHTGNMPAYHPLLTPFFVLLPTSLLKQFFSALNA